MYGAEQSTKVVRCGHPMSELRLSGIRHRHASNWVYDVAGAAFAALGCAIRFSFFFNFAREFQTQKLVFFFVMLVNAAAIFSQFDIEQHILLHEPLLVDNQSVIERYPFFFVVVC